jgi:hypothetical protein
MTTIAATTAGDIILAAQQRADMENSEFISDSEWLTMANASCQNLWDRLIEAYGNDYEVATPYTVTTDGTNDAFDLPTDFYKLLGVDLQLGANSSNADGWITIWRFNFAQRNQYTLPNIFTLWGRTNIKYRIRGGKIWFIPLPAGGQYLRLWYAPLFTPLTSTSTSVDIGNGWTEWVVNDMAMKARVKEESPIDGIQALQAVQEDRLRTIMENRDAGAPATVVDVYRVNGEGGYGDGSGFGGDWGP